MIYVIQVTPMNELKVRAALEREGISAYVPRREIIIRKSGGWTKAVPVMLPSYVFLDCDYCPEVHHIVKSVDGVINWLGKPTPITGEEEAFMRLIINGGIPIPESTADVDNDRNVTVTSGWLKGNEQYIIGYNIRKKRALLEIRFGGRLHRTSVGVEYTKV